MKRVGIIGCGGISKAHITGYRRTGMAQPVAFYDEDTVRAEKTAVDCGGTAYGSLEAMLSNAELDAVSVCTPPSSHEEIACQALRSGKPVCCEKPLAHNAASGRRMKECSEETATLLITAFKFRFFPNVLWAKNLLQDGRLGTVVSARNTFAGVIDMSNRWFSKKQISGGGVILDNGVHGVDLMRYLFGEVRGVFSVTADRGIPMEVEDSCRILLDMETDVWASVDLSWATPQSKNILEIQATKGLVELWWNGGRFTSLSGECDQFAWPEEPSEADPFAAQLQWFLECVDGVREPRASAGDGVRALEIIEAAYRSAANPGWVVP